MDIRELLEISKHNLHYGTEAETQMYSDRVMEVAGLLKKNPDFVGIKGSKQKITAPLAQGSKAFNATDGRFNIQQTAFPKQYVPKDIYDAAVKFNKEYDKAVVESEKAEREQKRKNLLIAFNAKNGIIMADDPRLNELLDPNDPLLGTVGQAIKDFGAAPKAESEEEFGAFDAAKKQKILDDIIGFKKFQSETPGFKKQPSDVIEDISKPKQLDGQTFYNKYALNQHLKDKELQSITEKAAQEISKKHWLAGDISEFASKRISDEEAKIKKLNADIHNIVNGHKVVSVGDENYKYSKLTDDEKMLYNYFVMEQTPDMKTSLAGRYLKSLELGLEQRVAVDKAESMNGFEKGIYLFGHGIGGSLENIANIGGDFGYDPTEGELLASAIIEGEEDGFAKFVYQSISTISEQIPALAVGFATGGAGYSAVLSANIMSQSIKEAMQNNKTLIQGVSYGAVQASMELVLERMLGGIGGKFLGKGSSSVVVKTLNKIDDIFTSRIPKALLKGAVVRLENGFGEFTQEFIQGITDPAIKNIIYQENNTYSLGTLNEALYQGLLGAISGMFLGGGVNATQTTAYYETLGDSLSDSQVLDFAKEAGNVKSELYRELSEKARKGKELTAAERGMLSKETTDLVYNNATFTKETLKFMATEGSVKQISDVLFGGNTEAAEIFKTKFSDSEYVDILMFGENETVDASFVEKALNPTVPETAATEAMAEGQTVPTAEGEANAEVETVATDSIAHPAPTAGKVLKMTPVSAKAKNYVKDIAKRLGTNLEFVDMAAELAKRGQNVEGLVIYPEGFYDPETHTLYVGNDVSNPVEFVFKHELTHYGERSKYYADFARAVRDSKAFKKWLDTQATYTAKDTAGKELQLHLILKERYEKVKNLTEPEAQREVIANFVADVLFKGDVETLSEILNEATPTQKNAVMRFLSDFFSWLKSKFTGSKQITSEIADLENMFRELISDATVNPMPTESEITYDTAENEANESMSVPASEGAVNEKTTEEVGVELDEKTESVSPLSFSLASWERSDYVTKRDKASAELAEALGISNKKAKAYIDSINGIAKVIADSRIRLDYVSSKGRSSFVSNAEYGGSIDFSTLCKKRGILTGTFSAIQKALRHSALTAEEILDIRNRLKEKGLEVSCGLCYVEGSRAQMGKFSKEFIERYKKRNPEYVPDMFDVNTPEGVEQLRIDHPEVYEAYEQFWNNKGVLNPGDSVLFASQQKPKLYQMRTEYNNEILEKFKNDDNVNEKNKNGGLRLQSFSDFEIVHLIDTMQVILDMSKVGLAGQAYTKVADFALALGNTGLKINLSLIAKGVDADGNLVFDDVEGMPIDTAMRIRDMYSDNVGTILVIFNDAQLKAALADNRVDFIIPFHRSQWKKALYEKLGLPKGTKDYTYQQNERYIKPVYYTTKNNTIGKRKATNYMPNEYWDFSKSGKENAKAYLKMCAENNKRPKFYKLLVDNKDGSYSLQPDGSTDGYWKLLIDFKMYNNEGVGVPQQPVKPDFNMEESMRMLEEYKGGHEQFPVDQETVDEFVSEYREKHKMDDFTEQKAEPKSVKTVYDNLSLSVPATDQAYLSAVENGDMDTAQRMVNAAAKAAGYSIEAYHGSRDEFTVFSSEKRGSSTNTETSKRWFFAADKTTANSYYPYGVIEVLQGKEAAEKLKHKGKLYHLFLRMNNPLEVDVKDYDYASHREKRDAMMEYSEQADHNGNDGIILYHALDNQLNTSARESTVYMFKESSQAKSADPVTYDDNGNVIPLSERFNPENNDIRFSVPASEGEAVTPKSLFNKVQKGEISYEEFVKVVNEGWSEAGKTYGVKPDGEMVTANNKPANVPNKVAPDKTVRRFVRNVLEANYSKDFNNALKSETLAKNNGTVYEVQSNKDLVERARKKIARQNIGTAQENWLKDTDRINPEKIAIGESLLVLAEQEGRIEDGVQLASELAIMFTTAGQVVQAASLFKRLGSIGKFIYLQKVVNKLNRDIARRYKNADPLVLNETLAAQLLETKTEEEAELVLDAIKAELGQQMPSNFLDKWNAWRYMSMLVNPTTHIRNFTGNLLFKPAIAMSEALSATIQSGVGAVQRARGKEFEKTTTFKANKRDKEFAKKDWEKNRKNVMSSGKYEDVSDIEDNRRIYKNGILEGVRKGNSNLLEWEDGIFLKNHYIRTLARYLTANKINPETASEAQLRRARDYARKKAQEYTYRDASKVANWLSKTAKDFKGADFLINGIIPFKKTPINVLKRGIEYSPLGFIKSLVDYGTKVRKGDMTVGEFIDGLASATTGTGLFILGAFLSNLGVLKGDFDDDDKWFEKLRGHQEYSIELFGVSYTINWAAPSSVPMFMGAAFSNFQSDEDGNWFDNLLSMGVSGLEPVLELTMLQGVNDALDAVSYAEDNEKLWTLGGNILTSYATQGLPTIGGKIANVIDNKRRTKYIDPSKGSVTLQTMWDTFSKKVPLLSMTRAEYIDAWGREEHTGNVIERFFAQFVSPGYASTIDPDPIYNELKAIKESTGEAGVYPEAPRKYITVVGNRRDLTKEEYYNVATMSGQTKMNLVNEAMDHKYYDKLTDKQKAEVIMNIYKYSNKLAVASELDFNLDEIKAGLGDKKGSVLTESRWNGFSFEQQQYLIHEAFMDGVITAYKYEQNGGSAAEYFILKALKNN